MSIDTTLNIHTGDALPAHLHELLEKVGTASKEGGSFRVRGDISASSSLGTMVRLGWVTFTSECRQDCWILSCPDPSQHVRRFTMTRTGWTALAALNREPPRQSSL
jgi:hypothetical protein